MNLEDRCVDCNHKRGNHMQDSNTGKSDCDFPDCKCHEFREQKRKEDKIISLIYCDFKAFMVPSDTF